MKNHKYNFPVGAAMAALLACAAPQSARGEVEDITAQYVSNADFTGAQSVWNINSNMSSTQQGNSCQEFWNGDINSAYFQMSQTVHGLPDGVYRLTANAFTRSAGDNSRQTCLYAIADGKEYATPLKLLHEETGAYGSTPDNPAQAKAAFAAGYWLNTVDHIAVTGGQLTIGARNMGQLRTGSSNGSWTILGRIRLYRLTGSDLSSLMDNTLADAQALANEGNHTGLDALQAAITAAQSVPANLLEGDDILALQQAMATYRASRMGDATEANPVDATHLVRNAGFEDGFIPVLPTANGGYAFPAGWEGSYGETDVNNNIGRGMEGTIQSGYNAEISPSEGKQALAARMRWSSGSVMEVCQKLQLPAGKYSLSADLGNLAVDESATVTVEDGDGTALCSLSPTSSTLATQSSTFEVVQSTGSTLRIKLVQSGQTDARMVVDNIRLSYFGAASLSTEAQQEAMLPRLDKLTEEFIADFNNRPMQKSSWKTLVQRVAESEAAKDNTDATPATLKEAADNLEAAMRNAAPSVAAYHRLSTTLDLFSENEGALAEGSFRDLYLEAQALFSAATATAEEADEAAASLRKAYPGYLASTLATSFDVTAFIANPSFEDGEAPAAVDEPNIYAPSGWNVEFEADNAYTGYKHIRSIPYGTAYDGTTPESSDEENGTALLYMRTNWDAAQNMRVYQDVWLPAGKYRLSADINHLSGTPDRQYTYVETGGTHLSLWPSATGTWETVTQEFELEEDGEITLSFGFSTPGGNNAVKLLADHVKLELVPPTYITNYVAAMQEALKWQEQLDVTAFPSVAERLSAAIGTEVGNGEEAAYLAATALLQEAAAYGRSACAINQENGDATGILANPEANEGTTGWETSLTGIQNRESYKGTADNYFEGGNQDETAWEASMQQVLYLPAGYYSLSFTGRSSASASLAVSLNGQTLTLPAMDAIGGNVQAYATPGSAEAQVNAEKGYGWNIRRIGFHIEKDAACTLSVTARADAQGQWFSIDGFALRYAAKAGTLSANKNHVAANGAVMATDLAQLLSEETRSVDLREVTVLQGSIDWPADMNPNCIVYAPTGLLTQATNIVCNGICTDLSVTDRKPLNVPEAFTALTATYSRDTYTDGRPETLTVPFECDFPQNVAFEEITEETDTYLKSAATTDARLQTGKAYLMAYTGEYTEETTIKTVFEATDVTIPAFEEPVAEGLFGSTDYYYVGENETAVYMLSDAKGIFEQAHPGSCAEPFRACYRPASGQAQSSLKLILSGGVSIPSTTMGSEEGKVDVYDLGGRMIRRQTERKEALQGLQPGVYIVGRQKVIIK